MYPSDKLRKPAGTIMLRTTGYRFVKLQDGKWQSEHRIVAANRIVHRELLPNERVFHKDGNRQNNMAENLAVITFNTTPFKRLEHSRLIFMPRAVVKRPVGRPKRELVAA